LNTSKLGELVSFASEHSAFYRDRLGGRVDQSEVVLESMPPITKTEWMAELDQVVTDRRLQRSPLEQHLETSRAMTSTSTNSV
jgi:hypothetical protein